MYSWSLKLSKDDVLKKSVDSVVAAICQLEPSFFRNLLQKFFDSPLTISNQSEILRASVSDDAKDDIQQGKRCHSCHCLTRCHTLYWKLEFICEGIFWCYLKNVPVYSIGSQSTV